MSHYLVLLNSSAGTVNLNSGNIRMMEQYVPMAGDGDNAFDGVQLEFSGGTITDAQAAIQSVISVMDAGVLYNQRHVGSETRIVFQPEATSGQWTSRITAMNGNEWKLYLDPDALSKARWSDSIKVQGYLTWKRQDWWVGSAVDLDWTNPNGANGGVYPVNDYSGSSPSMHVNYIDIAGTALAAAGADMHSPLRFYLYSGKTEQYIKDLWITANIDDDAAYTEFDVGGTLTASSVASGGSVMRSALNTTWVDFSGTITNSSLLGWYDHQEVGFLVRTVGFPPENTVGYLHWTRGARTEEFQFSTDSEIQLITSLDFNFSPLDHVYTYYGVKNDDGGTINMDFAGFIPLSNYLHVDLDGTINSLWWVMIDGDHDADKPAASWMWSTYHIERPVYGPQIFLHPGRNYRLRFFWTSNGGTVDPTDHLDLTHIHYLPRRRLV